MEIRALDGGLTKCKIAKLHYETFSKIWSRFHFTSEIALNDKCLSQFFLDGNVL